MTHNDIKRLAVYTQNRAYDGQHDPVEPPAMALRVLARHAYQRPVMVWAALENGQDVALYSRKLCWRIVRSER